MDENHKNSTYAILSGLRKRWHIGLIITLILLCGAFAVHLGIRLYSQIQSHPLEARDTHISTIFQEVSNRQSHPCPENAFVVIIAGQSQAANSNTHLSKRKTHFPAYNYYNGVCYLIEDPMLGGEGAGGSLWVEFAHMYFQETDRPIIIGLRAFNASSIAQWTDGNSDYRISLEKELLMMSSSGIKPDMFLWFQGETDALYNIEKDDYKAHITDLFTSLSAPSLLSDTTQWLLVETSICKDVATKYLPIQQARLEFSALHESVHIGPDTDALGKEFRQADGCHFNQAAKKKLAEQLVEMTKRF